MISFNDAARRFSTRQAKHVLPILIVLLAALLRFHMLGHQSLWNDEGNSLRLAQRSVSGLISAAAQDIHPPGYYLTLKAWQTLTGDSEFALRSLSALAGILTVACVYALGKALFAPGVGLIASALVAINSFAVYYSQEARMYTLVTLCAAAALLFFVRWTARPTWRDGVALALINAAGLYIHYTYPLMMIVQGVLFVARIALTALTPRSSPEGEGSKTHALESPSPLGMLLPHNWGRSGWGGGFRVRAILAYIALNLLTLALFAPILPTALRQVSAWPHTGQPINAGEGIPIIARWLVYGNTSLAANWWVYVWPTVFILAAFIPDWVRRRQPFAWRLALPWLILAVSIVPLFALDLFRDANLKFLLPAQIATALLIGRGAWLLWELGTPNLFILLEAAPRILAGIGMLSLAMISSDALDNLYNVSGFARDDYRAMAQVITDDPRPGDMIVLDAPNQQETFSYYYHGVDLVLGLPAGLGGDNSATRTAIQAAIHSARRVFALYWGEDERDPQHIVENELNAATFPAWSRWYGNVRMVLYAVPSAPARVPTQMLNASFGGLIRLNGTALDATTVQAGDVIGVTLFWEAEKPIPKRYKVFLHLLAADGHLVAQRDSEPANNSALTTSWTPGQTVIDSQGVLVPPGLATGDYSLIVGLYDVNDPTARLTLNPTDSTTDHVTLGVIRVK